MITFLNLVLSYSSAFNKTTHRAVHSFVINTIVKENNPFLSAGAGEIIEGATHTERVIEYPSNFKLKKSVITNWNTVTNE